MISSVCELALCQKISAKSSITFEKKQQNYNPLFQSFEAEVWSGLTEIGKCKYFVVCSQKFESLRQKAKKSHLTVQFPIINWGLRTKHIVLYA